jgi:hypothetical protein
MATIRPEITGKQCGVTVEEAERPIGPPAGDPEDIESAPPKGDVTGPQVEQPRARGPRLDAGRCAREHKLAQALISSQRLSPDQALRRRLVERELQRVVADFIDRFIAVTRD